MKRREERLVRDPRTSEPRQEAHGRVVVDGEVDEGSRRRDVDGPLRDRHVPREGLGALEAVPVSLAHRALNVVQPVEDGQHADELPVGS